MLCRAVSCMPGLCPPDANSTTQPLYSHESKECIQILPNVVGEAEYSLLENHWVRLNKFSRPIIFKMAKSGSWCAGGGR